MLRPARTSGQIGLMARWRDIFDLQDEVTVAVVSAIQPKLLQTEIEMATRRRPENLTAYDLLSPSQAAVLPSDPRRCWPRRSRLAHRALELDPRFGFGRRLWQVSVTCKASFRAMLSILNSTARKQFGLFAWH